MTELPLQTGPLRLLYYAGYLRYVYCGQSEILRMIYFAFRDHNWNTLALSIRNEKIEAREDGFTITYDAMNESDGESICEWQVAIEGENSGRITFEIKGTVKRETWRNRIGLCILHPDSTAGTACELFHPDGTRSTAAFPVEVEPLDPFRNMHAMRWKAGGIWWKLEFEGDAFETEDQRNWTDASFKTFSTPLEIPFPVLVKPGDHIHQKVTLEPESKPATVRRSAQPIVLEPGNDPKPFPAIGTHWNGGNPAIASHVKSLSPAFCVADINFNDPTWGSKIDEAISFGQKAGVPLSFRLECPEEASASIDEFLARVRDVQIHHVTLLSTGRPVTDKKTMSHADSIRNLGIVVGGGTSRNFTEVNRNRLETASLDYISFAANPQEHASDELTIMENIAGQTAVSKTARRIYPGKKIHVTPVSLRRFQQPDARMRTSFAAEFMAGCILAHILAGTDVVSFFQTSDLINADGSPYPVYELLRACCHSSGIRITRNEKVAGAWFEGGGSKFLIVVNFTGLPQKVKADKVTAELKPHQVRLERLG